MVAVASASTGGVPVAAKVAAALNASLDLILVRKIGLPYQPELAMGAVVDGDNRWSCATSMSFSLQASPSHEFNAVCDSELAKIERRRQRYLGSSERVEVAGRIVIVIDDGVATGATTRAALRATRSRKPKKLILVVPVAPADGLAVLPPRTNLRTSSGLVKGSLTGPDAAGGRRSCMSGDLYRIRSNRILLFQLSAGLGRRSD